MTAYNTLITRIFNNRKHGTNVKVRAFNAYIASIFLYVEASCAW